MTKSSILVARAIFPEVLEMLSQHFQVESNQSDEVLSAEILKQKMHGKVGALTTGSERIDAALLQANPQLKIVSNMAVGYNNFDVPAMTACGVLATNTPDVLTETTADFGFALLMATARRITESEHYLRQGLWTKWSYDMFAGAEVHGSTLGIIGMGRIGQGIAKRAAHGFGMRVIYHNRSRLSADLEASCKATYVAKEELLRTADHVLLVVPYSAALALALKNKQIAAAGLDVFEGEPALNAALLTVPNVVLTPHIASSTIQTRMAMAKLAADNLVAYLRTGQALTPLNQVPLNPALLSD